MISGSATRCKLHLFYVSLKKTILPLQETQSLPTVLSEVKTVYQDIWSSLKQNRPPKPIVMVVGFTFCEHFFDFIPRQRPPIMTNKNDHLLVGFGLYLMLPATYCTLVKVIFDLFYIQPTRFNPTNTYSRFQLFPTVFQLELTVFLIVLLCTFHKDKLCMSKQIFITGSTCTQLT